MGGPARRRNTVVAAIGAILLGVIGVAVVGGRANERERRMAIVMAQFEAFTNQICTCRDRACAEMVGEQMTKWSAEVARTMPQDEKPDEAMMKKAQALGERMSTCMMKAYEIERPESQQQGGGSGTVVHER